VDSMLVDLYFFGMARLEKLQILHIRNPNIPGFGTHISLDPGF